MNVRGDVNPTATVSRRTGSIGVRVWAAVTLLAVLAVCAVNVVGMARRVLPPPRVDPAFPANAVMRHEQRMAALRAALESRDVRGTIGYVADVAAADLPASPRGMEDYFLTQFALVPWVLDARAPEYDWVVTDLRAASIAERTPAGYRVADDCGDGVFLLRRVERAAP